MVGSLIALLGETALKHVKVSVVGSLGMLRSYGIYIYNIYTTIGLLSVCITCAGQLVQGSSWYIHIDQSAVFVGWRCHMYVIMQLFNA